MSNSFQNFVATSIPRAISDLIAATERLPEDKQNWCPMGNARTALDMLAEVAFLSETTAHVIREKSFPKDFDFAAYQVTKKAWTEEGLPKLKERLHENSAKVVAAILDVSEADLEIEVTFPWGVLTLRQCMSHPYWNPIYHEGQINYLASMLGCLD